MISDPYTVMTAILQDNTAITSLLGTYQGTSIPLIKGGVLEKTETDLPAITFYSLGLDRTKIINDMLFNINCYAETERESFILANTIVQELNEANSGVDGYQARTTARIIGAIPDPASKEVNTPVEVRIVNIFN